MDRGALNTLKAWLDSRGRKPLIIRGARQVGKTWLVRRFAELAKKQLIELNFERESKLITLFESNNPKQILLNLEIAFRKDIKLDNSLLFLDEIQARPELLAKLRWFAEEMPEMPVIATGSLLDFVLAKHSFSMPVGRISYFYLEPLSFEEFLRSQKNDQLLTFIQNFSWEQKIPELIHQSAMDLFKEYIVVGGLPAAVFSWSDERSINRVNEIHYNLIATYQDDFNKYAGRLSVERLSEVMSAIPNMIGNKFVYSKVNKEVSSAPIKQALQSLINARLCHPVYATHANGIPLAAEVIEKNFKTIFIDVGLVSGALDLRLTSFRNIKDINLINQGKISEQVVGQILRTIEPFYIDPKLYYWSREEKGSSAEIDYLMQHEGKIIPIEVKSGSTGQLKSLHLFMHLKKLNNAIRINSDFPSQTQINFKLHDGTKINYILMSLPFYLLGQLHRLLRGHAE